MSTDVKFLEDLRGHVREFGSRFPDDGNVQLCDALISAIDDVLFILDSDE